MGRGLWLEINLAMEFHCIITNEIFHMNYIEFIVEVSFQRELESGKNASMNSVRCKFKLHHEEQF